jgi:thymidylate kinase
MSAYANADKVIFDRGHFSEIVYDNLWRGGSALNSWEQSFLAAYVFENFLTIFVKVPTEILKKRYQSRNYDQIITEHELEIVQAKFDALLSHPKVLRYEATTKKALDDFVGKIIDLLTAHGLNQKVVQKTSVSSPNKKTFVLLEGSNGSGKSTLSKLLKVSMVGWGVKTLDYKSINPFQRYLNEYCNNHEIIFDRGHFSEVVYGNIFRNGKHFSNSELNLLNDYVRNRGIVILCDPPVEVLAQRIAHTEYPKHIHESRLGQVREEFQNVLQQANIPYYHLDTIRKDSIQNVINSVTQTLATEPYSKMGWEKPKDASL